MNEKRACERYIGRYNIFKIGSSFFNLFFISVNEKIKNKIRLNVKKNILNNNTSGLSERASEISIIKTNGGAEIKKNQRLKNKNEHALWLWHFDLQKGRILRKSGSEHRLQVALTIT